MKIIIIFVIFVIFLSVYTRYIEKRSIFFPFRQIEVTPQDLGLRYEDVNFKTSDGQELNGWYIPATDSKMVLLFFHGNGGNISHRLEKILIFNKLGLSVFIIDYRGYGRSTGKPTEQGIYLDAQAAYEYLLEERKTAAQDIVLFGESLGAQVAVDLASREQVAALIIESGFTSARDMARVIYPFLPSFFLSVRFDSLAKISKIRSPKLIIHSINDEIVPFRLGKKLFQAASEPKRFLEIRGAHNNAVFDSSDLVVAEIRSMLSSLN